MAVTEQSDDQARQGSEMILISYDKVMKDELGVIIVGVVNANPVGSNDLRRKLLPNKWKQLELGILESNIKTSIPSIIGIKWPLASTEFPSEFAWKFF